jgi:uroporphyrin-III C-methyltransferase/precorrin-2 dehydrogenase/sirohydrochlorin ferrochelatase
MQQLPIFLNLAGQPVLLVGDGAAADAKRRLIEAAGGIVVDDGPARLAFVAIDDAGEARRIADVLRARRILVNVVDKPALCDFTIPAIIDRSPVTVAIGTGGTSASLAKALRERLEVLLPAPLGRLAGQLRAARARLVERFPDAAERRGALDAMLAPGGSLDPLADPGDVEAAIDAAAVPAGSRHAVVVVDSDDPDDLRLYQLRLLAQADAIVRDDDVADAIVDRARRDAVRLAPDEASAASGLVVTIRRRSAP